MAQNRHFLMRQSSLLSGMLIVIAVMGITCRATAQTPAPETHPSNVAALLERHAALEGKLAKNQYRRPLFLESSESPSHISSTAYAVLQAPFSTVSATFKKPSRWCEILILHLNTKYCHAIADTSPGTLAVHIGKKNPQRLAQTTALEFAYRVTADAPDYLAVQLHSDKGPLSTHNYRMQLQAAPLGQDRTFMYFRYSYDYGVAGRLAMKTYLATLGRGKVGFTPAPESSSGYVSGMRGTVERNTMRYYLAMEAYLASLTQMPEQQFSARLRYWFDATEEYPRQLHELDRASYLSMKQAEYRRQQVYPAVAD
jgi:hypothetical protein